MNLKGAAIKTPCQFGKLALAASRLQALNH